MPKERAGKQITESTRISTVPSIDPRGNQLRQNPDFASSRTPSLVGSVYFTTSYPSIYSYVIKTSRMIPNGERRRIMQLRDTERSALTQLTIRKHPHRDNCATSASEYIRSNRPSTDHENWSALITGPDTRVQDQSLQRGRYSPNDGSADFQLPTPYKQSKFPSGSSRAHES